MTVAATTFEATTSMALSPGEETTLLRALCFWRMSRRASPEQIHELKRDKFRSSPRRMEIRMRLWSRNGRDWSVEFVAITSAIMALPVTRIVLDGEAVAHCRTWTRCSGCATGLLHLDVKDLRPLELRERRALLRKHRRRRPRLSSTASTWTARTARRCSGSGDPFRRQQHDLRAARHASEGRCGYRRSPRGGGDRGPGGGW